MLKAVKDFMFSFSFGTSSLYYIFRIHKAMIQGYQFRGCLHEPGLAFSPTDIRFHRLTKDFVDQLKGYRLTHEKIGGSHPPIPPPATPLRKRVVNCTSFHNVSLSVLDVLHTYFGLCGLSLMSQPGLLSVDAALSISERAKDHLERLHALWR